MFLGQRLDIPEILGSLDLFAFSTTSAEGFGIVLIEAMAAGLLDCLRCTSVSGGSG